LREACGFKPPLEDHVTSDAAGAQVGHRLGAAAADHLVQLVESAAMGPAHRARCGKNGMGK
jgi:hypothetical protein